MIATIINDSQSDEICPRALSILLTNMPNSDQNTVSIDFESLENTLSHQISDESYFSELEKFLHR